MLFVEFRFFVFFALVFCVAWSLRNDGWRKSWLLLCSYVFYGAWNWKFLSLIWISTAVDYIVGLALERSDDPRRRKLLLTVSMCVNLGLLGVFKYFNFFVDSAAGLAGMMGFQAHLPTLSVILPVGISFYTFQTMSYTIDVYRRAMPPTRNLLDFALFVAFFPQLVAGPIVRAKDFIPQLVTRPVFETIRWRPAMVLFLIGFFKKACVSDNIAPFVDAYFADPSSFDALSSWIAVCLYSVQIYCDFSGYSDMAIAVAAMLGYRLCLNFAHPYFSTSITVFWRRWHISLSSWLRDYLYISLGGNRGGYWLTLRNLMLTMLLGGLWHGAGWNFVVWGFMHGAALILHRWWDALRARLGGMSALPPIVGLVITYYFVNVTWIFFRASDFPTAWTAVQAYCGLVDHGTRQLPTELLGILGLLLALHAIAYRGGTRGLVDRLPAPAFATLYGVACHVCLLLMPTGYRPFIYFQF